MSKKTISTEQKRATRLVMLLDKLELTPYQASKKMGYSTPSVIYHVINGKNKLSYELLYKMKMHLNDKINMEWVLNGTGEMFLQTIQEKGYGNEVRVDGNLFYPIQLDKNMLKYIGNTFIKSFYNETGYEISVSPALIFGIQFHIHKANENKGVVIIISPSWKVYNYTSVDYWRSMSINLRCQENILSNQIIIILNNAIYNVIKKLEKKTSIPKPFLDFNLFNDFKI